jgi:predicted metalloendopeptidase
MFHHYQSLKKLNKIPDNKIWHMGAHEVNAYYNPVLNEIVLPTGILQAPFFDINATDSENYGGIGTTIAHEIMHGFDDEGRKYDFDGNLNNWWTKDDNDIYQEKSQKLINYYNNIILLNKNLNGKLTLGENIADLYGVILSLDALPDKTELMKFFTSYAKTWRQKIRDEEIINKILIDPHSPAECRVNLVLKNLPEFQNVYNIAENDKMYLNEFIRIF